MKRVVHRNVHDAHLYRMIPCPTYITMHVIWYRKLDLHPILLSTAMLFFVFFCFGMRKSIYMSIWNVNAFFFFLKQNKMTSFHSKLSINQSIHHLCIYIIYSNAWFISNQWFDLNHTFFACDMIWYTLAFDTLNFISL